MEEQLDLAREKVISTKAANEAAAVQSKGKLACLQRACNSSRQRIFKNPGTVLHKEIEMVMAKVSDLELENRTLQKKFETSLKTHLEAKVGLAEDPGKRVTRSG